MINVDIHNRIQAKFQAENNHQLIIMPEIQIWKYSYACVLFCERKQTEIDQSDKNKKKVLSSFVETYLTPRKVSNDAVILLILLLEKNKGL